jgi:hypothetical protein
MTKIFKNTIKSLLGVKGGKVAKQEKSCLCGHCCFPEPVESIPVKKSNLTSIKGGKGKISTVRFFMPALLFFTLLISSCSKKNAIQETKPEYTAEEIFQGMFFMQGDVAKNIKAYQEPIARINALSEEQKLAYQDFAKDMTNAVSTTFPNYLPSLQHAVKEKDVDVLEKMLQKGALYLHLAGLKQGVYQKYGFDMQEMDIESLQDYDFTSEQDIEKFLQKFPIFQKEKPSYFQGKCLYPFAVVAVAVWEAAAIANVVSVFTAWAITYAAFWNYSDIMWKHHTDNLTNKELIISDLLNL